jgi:hypothetical protein
MLFDEASLNNIWLTFFHNISMRSLHEVHKWTHIGLVSHVRLSVCMIQLENRWTDLDEIWYGRYAIGD